MDVNDGHALRGVALDAIARHLLCFICGVVENLHVEEFGWVVET